MSVEESIKVLEEIAEGFEKMSTEECARNDLRALWEGRAKGIRQAIALIKAHLRDQPNDPMTMKQLQEMDGEPVWIEADKWHIKGKWGLVSVWAGPTGGKFTVYVFDTKTGPTLYPNQEYGRCWLAYRRKPEDGEAPC